MAERVELFSSPAEVLRALKQLPGARKFTNEWHAASVFPTSPSPMWSPGC